MPLLVDLQVLQNQNRSIVDVFEPEQDVIDA